MRRFFRLAALALATALVLPPAAGAADVLTDADLADRYEAIDRRIAELMPWIAGKTGYRFAEEVKVTVLIRPDETIERIVYPDGRGNRIRVAAIAVGQTIMLPDWFELGEHDGILVHELVHVLQHANAAEFACAILREGEAYEIETAFVEEFGVGAPPHPLFRMFLSFCPRPEPWRGRAP